MKKAIFKVTVLFLIIIAITPAFSISGSDALAKFKSKMYSFKTLQGVITINYTSGRMITGSFKYMAPGKFYFKMTNPAGKIIATNGKKLWVYDASTAICGIQEAGGLSGGLASFANGYYAIATSRGSDTIIKLKSPDRTYSDVNILVDSSFMLKKVSFKNKKGDGFSVSLSGLRIGENIHSGIFDFNVPSNAQVIKDPLNIR